MSANSKQAQIIPREKGVKEAYLVLNPSSNFVESFKIDNFKRENPGEDFPWFRSIVSDECLLIQNRLAKKLVLGNNDQPQEIVNRICGLGYELGNFEASASITDALKAAFLKENITVAKNVYINWYRFDKIDQMQFLDLIDHFDDVWYPGAGL